MILRTNNGCQPFYEVMGRFFADRAFIKEMDCQLYDSGFEWYLYYDGENICGFASVEKRDKYAYLDNFYVFEKYRHKGVGTAIIREIVKDYGTMRAITRNIYARSIFEEYGFICYGKNGRYFKMERKINGQ